MDSGILGLGVAYLALKLCGWVACAADSCLGTDLPDVGLSVLNRENAALAGRQADTGGASAGYCMLCMGRMGRARQVPSHAC